MHIVVLAAAAAQGTDWQQRVENLGEDWRCTVCQQAGQVLALLRDAYADALVLLAHPQRGPLMAQLCRQPPLAPPRVLAVGADAPDGRIACAEELPGRLGVPGLPALAEVHLPQVEALARSFLRMMGAPPHLRAWAFLPEMVALTVVYPPCLTDLQHGLYPCIARRHGLTPSAVERSLRLWIESTWVRGDMDALERFFGHTIDPERGKPTNREFLCGVRPWVVRGAGRVRPEGR